jgi:hypothetical protein
VNPVREQALSAAQNERIEQEVQLIGEVVLEQQMNERLAPVGEEGLPG